MSQFVLYQKLHGLPVAKHQAQLYDLSVDTLTLSTEYTVPSEATDVWERIVKGREENQFMRVERNTDSFKITFVYKAI